MMTTTTASDDDHGRIERLLDESAPPMTENEYANLKELLSTFCTIPMVGEHFRAPVVELYPEVSAIV